MKRNSLFVAVCAFSLALTSRAVIIAWTLPESSTLESATSAMLVYVPSGVLQLNTDGSLASGSGTSYDIGSTDLQNAQHGFTVQTTVGTPAGTGSSGNYYLVLLKTADSVVNYTAGQIAASSLSTYTEPTDPSALVTSWTPLNFTAWAAAPEPSSVALLLLGAAFVAFRRKCRQT